MSTTTDEALLVQFACAALTGQLANSKWPNCGESGLPASEEECAAHWSYQFARKMLVEHKQAVAEMADRAEARELRRSKT